MSDRTRHFAGRHLSMVGLASASLAAVVALLIFGLFGLLIREGTLRRTLIEEQLSDWSPPVAGAFLVAAALVVMLATAWLLVHCARERVSVQRLPPVATVAALVLALSGSPIGFLPARLSLLAGLLIVGPLLLKQWRERSAVPPKDDDLSTLLQAIGGPHGLAPLPDLPSNGDALGRGDLFNVLMRLLESWRWPSLTIALEGSWGIGKTSLLNALASQLRQQGQPVVVFSAWNYREPENILGGYFDAVSDAIGAGVPLRKELKSLSRQLASIPSSPLVRFLANLSLMMSGSLARSRRSLEDRLAYQRAVILIDDLDRLDASELQAVLRAVRLMSDLSGVRQVLAYDRTHLARQLSLPPEDARVFMAKIVNVELAISAPLEVLYSMLVGSLEPLMTSAEPAEAEELRDSLSELQRRRIARSLGTPREIKRVVTAAALKWKLDQGWVNLRDTFFLTLLQYIWPAVFASVREHQELYVDSSMWADLDRISHEDDWREKAKEHVARIREEWGDVPASIVEHLFPNVTGESPPSESNAFRERRIYHPAHFDRYFHVYFAPSIISVPEIRDFVEQAVQQPSGVERRAWFGKRLAEFADRGRLGEWLERFETQREEFQRRGDGPDARIDLAVAMSEYSGHLPVGGWLWSQGGAATSVLSLIADLEPSMQNMVLKECIEQATGIVFAGELVDRAVHPTEPSIFDWRQLQLDSQLAAKIFGERMNEWFPETSSILNADRPTRVAIIGSAGDSEPVRTRILDELKRSPLLLPRLVELGAARQGDVPSPSTFSYKILEDRVPWLQMANEVTEAVPLEEWKSALDRALVTVFREAVAEARQGGG